MLVVAVGCIDEEAAHLPARHLPEVGVGAVLDADGLERRVPAHERHLIEDSIVALAVAVAVAPDAGGKSGVHVLVPLVCDIAFSILRFHTAQNLVLVHIPELHSEATAYRIGVSCVCSFPTQFFDFCARDKTGRNDAKTAPYSAVFCTLGRDERG